MDKKIMAGVIVALVLIVAAFSIGGLNKLSQEEAQALALQEATDAKAEAELVSAGELAAAQAQAEAERLAAEEANALEVAALQEELAAMQVVEAEEEAEEEAELLACSYELDGLLINLDVEDEVLSDRELDCALFDGEVKWDGDTFEAEETLELSGLYIGSNYEDFGTDVCLEIQENEVYYRFEVEESFNREELGSEEFDGDFLEINLLGEDVKLSEWDCEEDSITFFKGNKHRLNEGESLTVGDVTLYVPIITEDSIWVEVGDDSDEIVEGNSRMVGGLDIMVVSVLENEAGETQPDMVIIYVGSDVEVSVEDEDEYAEDSAWEWDITCEYIGLRLVEDFDEPDDDDFPALCAGEELCLPNDFLCIRFDGMVEENYREFNLDRDSEMMRVQGEFELELEDYDEVWCDEGNFYDDDDTEDEDTENLGSFLDLKGTDLELECVDAGSMSRVCFNDESSTEVCIRNNFDNANLDGEFVLGPGSLPFMDEDFISNWGIIIEAPEDCLEDEDCTVRVPNEKLEGMITVFSP